MNTKRWIAVGIAVTILLTSAFFGTSKMTANDETTDAFTSSFKDIFSKELKEDVIVTGSKLDRILVVPIEGVITSSSTYGYDHKFIMDSLESALTDASIKGVVLKVNSPGGGVFESAQIKDKVLEIKEAGKPVYAVFGNMAASGGYYVSAMADKIYASSETLTGSIGVIMSGYDMSELMNNLGIKSNVIKSAEHKDILSSSRPMTEVEKAYLQELIDNSFQRFVDLVAEGRNIPKNEVLKFADGRIFDGEQALRLKMIDGIAYFEDVIYKIQEENGLSNCEVFEYNSLTSRYDWLFSMKSNENNLDSSIDKVFRKIEAESTPQLMYIYGK